MIRALKRLLYLRQFSQPTRYRAIASAPCSLIITEASLLGIRDCIAPAIESRHEGIAYLFGQTDGETTLVTGAIRPDAATTPGSFHVSSVAMARIVRRVNEAGLQLVGQAHSHPGAAFHSEGDETGARIAYKGFVSIVVPDYGVHLPSLERAAIYVFRDGRFFPVAQVALSIVPRSLS
jgi:proteasome lid subunit RPN8/RPN11